MQGCWSGRGSSSRRSTLDSASSSVTWAAILVCAAFARPGRARGALLPPMSHWGGSGMHQETPGLLPFLRGGAPRLGLFLPALLPSPVGRFGSRASGSALSARVGTPRPPSLPRRSPACRSAHRCKGSRDLRGGLHPSSWWVDLQAGRAPS